jgi:hypothetical protein
MLQQCRSLVLPNNGASSLSLRRALSRALVATATRAVGVTPNIQPAPAGAVASTRALGGGFVQSRLAPAPRRTPMLVIAHLLAFRTVVVFHFGPRWWHHPLLGA